MGNRAYYKDLMETILSIGEQLLISGAEINRVEDTLTRLGAAFKAESTNVFVINTSIVVTMKFEGEVFTQTRRIFNSSGTDFGKLARLNALSREVTSGQMSPERLKEDVGKIKEIKPSKIKAFVGGALAAAAFALFFGGAPADAFAAAFFGIVIVFLQEYLSRICPNRMLFTFVSALVTGLGITFLSAALPMFHADKIIIGAIMLLVPGKGITNAARDVMLGDTVSGAMKLIESLFLTGALAAGYLLALSLI